MGKFYVFNPSELADNLEINGLVSSVLEAQMSHRSYLSGRCRTMVCLELTLLTLSWEGGHLL
jgi:hypothetical protein